MSFVTNELHIESDKVKYTDESIISDYTYVIATAIAFIHMLLNVFAV